MKKVIVSMLFILAASSAVFAAQPRLFFSDIISGPDKGGKDNNGVFVTVAGKNFGASQGQSYVSIGGGKAAAYPVWSDTKVSFQLGTDAASGNIVITTPDGNSNPLPFTVRDGNIYFVDIASPNNPGQGTYADPWRSPSSFVSAMRPGSACYIRKGTYTGTYASSRGNFDFQGSPPDGQLNNEIAFIGYPGEDVRIEGSSNFLFGYPKDYYVIAGFYLKATAQCIQIDATHLRVINNMLEGLKTHAYGILHPVSGNDIKIYGNELFGASSGSKLDHPIYIGYGGDNIDIGWNHIHDNNVAEGPAISINTDYAITSHYKFENVRIHDNIINLTKSSIPMRGIGIVATDRGSSVYIYNNVFIGGGSSNTIYQYSANSYVYNNTFYDSEGSSTLLFGRVVDGSNDYRPEIVDVKNNIFYNRSGTGYLSISDESSMTKVTVSNNNYFGNGSGPAIDTAAVNADPLFANAGASDFHISSASPCKSAGADITAIVSLDRDGVSRPQNKLFAIGAYEYFNGVSPTVSSGTESGLNPGVSGNDIVQGSGNINDTGAGTSTGAGTGSNPDITTDSNSGTGVTLNNNEVKVIGSTASQGTINPDKGESASIYFKGSMAGKYELKIFTVDGDLVWQDFKDNVLQDTFSWSPKGMASGIYIASIKGPGMNSAKKIVVLR